MRVAVCSCAETLNTTETPPASNAPETASASEEAPPSDTPPSVSASSEPATVAGTSNLVALDCDLSGVDYVYPNSSGDHTVFRREKYEEGWTPYPLYLDNSHYICDSIEHYISPDVLWLNDNEVLIGGYNLYNIEAKTLTEVKFDVVDESVSLYDYSLDDFWCDIAERVLYYTIVRAENYVLVAAYAIDTGEWTRFLRTEDFVFDTSIIKIDDTLIVKYPQFVGYTNDKTVFEYPTIEYDLVSNTWIGSDRAYMEYVYDTRDYYAVDEDEVISIIKNDKGNHEVLFNITDNQPSNEYWVFFSADGAYWTSNGYGSGDSLFFSDWSGQITEVAHSSSYLELYTSADKLYLREYDTEANINNIFLIGKSATP